MRLLQDLHDLFNYSNDISITKVEISCGSTSSENCTYFVSTGGEVGACRIKICPCSDDICQMRLDFQSFIINGPSTGIHKT